MKCISKQELAQLYFPDDDPRNATKRMMQWVYRCPDLMRALEDTHYSRHAKFLTARQLRLITEFLGEP